jgi:hypothetical protein
MQQDTVLHLIDTYLERLQKVRQLLSEVAASPVLTLTTVSQPASRSTGQSTAKADGNVATVRVIEPGEPSPKKRNTMPKKKTVGAEPLFAAAATETAETATAAQATIHPQPAPLGAAPRQNAGEVHSVLPMLESMPETADLAPAGSTTSTAAPEPVKPMLVRARLQRAMRVVKRRSSIPSSSALVGAVPAGPVFISAEKVRQQKSERQPEAVKKSNASEAPAAKPLTAEMLAQRWIQSPAW